MGKLKTPAFDPKDVTEASATGYPEPYKTRVAGRHKRRLGDHAGLRNFGVNLTRIDPGAESSMRHWHAKQDEFIYVLKGEVTLVTPASYTIDVTEAGATGDPGPYKPRVAGRHKRRLGDHAGLRNFGVNLTRIDPGAESSMRHWHAKQDEFIYVLKGEVTLVTDAGRQRLKPGMAAGFPAGKADGHQLVNETKKPVPYLEIGDRTPGDRAPDSDGALAAA